MNSIEDRKEVLHTILVNELRNVYNIKYHKDATKGHKVFSIQKRYSPLDFTTSSSFSSSPGQATQEQPRIQRAITEPAAHRRHPGERWSRPSAALYIRLLPEDPRSCRNGGHIQEGRVRPASQRDPGGAGEWQTRLPVIERHRLGRRAQELLP